MTRAVGKDWRGWLAAFCVVLVSFLYLEPAHAECNEARAVEGMSYADDTHVVHTHDDHTGHDHPADAPDHEGDEPHAHHCAGAHPVQLPASGGGLLEQRPISVVFDPETAAAATMLHFGLDRPPRVRAIV